MSHTETARDEDVAVESPTSPGAHATDEKTTTDRLEQGTHISLATSTHGASDALTRIRSWLTARDIVDPGPPPDGGSNAWTQAAMAWLVCFCTWGYVNSFGVFQAYYGEILDESPSTIAWVGSVQVWILFFASAISGRALDAGLFIPTLAIGSVVQVLGIFMTSLCTKYWQLLLAQGFCTGLGSGIFFTPTMGLVTTYFRKNRGVAVAFVSTGNSVGGSVYPIVVRQILPQVGLAWTVRVLGFINLALLGLAVAVLRPRLPPRKSGPIMEWRALTEVPYVLVVLGMLIVLGGLFFSFYFIASYARDIIGMSYADSLTMLIVFNAAAVPVRLMTGWLADRFLGPLNSMIPLLFINAVCAFAWIGVRSRAGMFAFSTFYGFSAGAFQSLFPTTLTSLNSDLSRNGVRIGMAFSFFSFAGLAGPPIGGALIATNGGGRRGYMAAQLALGFVTMLGATCMLAARVYKVGWSLKIKT